MPRILMPHQPSPANTVPIGGHVLARNTVLNLGARIISLLIAVLAMPYVIRHLGPDRFGLLSLAWIVVGYFAFLDLGIGASAHQKTGGGRYSRLDWQLGMLPACGCNG